MIGWSESRIEECIGVLWWILAAVMINGDSVNLWKVPFVLGLICQVGSIYFAVMERRINLLKKKGRLK